MRDWQWPPLGWLVRRTGIAMLVFALFATLAIVAGQDAPRDDGVPELPVEWVANAGDGCVVWRGRRQRRDMQWEWVYWRRCNGITM